MDSKSTISRRSLVRQAAVVAGAGSLAAAGLTIASPHLAQRAFAQDVEASFVIHETVMVTTDFLNLRSSASTSGTIIGTYPYGTIATISGTPVTNGGIIWYPVIIDGSFAEGWFASQFLAYTTEVTVDGSFTVVDGPLRLRSTASTSGSVIATYNNGATGLAIASATVVNQGYTWANVAFEDGNVGWLAIEFVNFGGGESGESFVITSGPLNLRSGPGTINFSVGSYPTGTSGTTLGEPTVAANGYTWAYVELSNGALGWLALEFVTFSSNQTFVVTDGPINVRSGPGTSYAQIDRYLTGASGSRLDDSAVSANGYTWIYVQFFDGVTGFIAAEFVTLS